MNNTHRIVSSEDEDLILVDADDNELGFRSKAECHDGTGILHRAFSLFLFNVAGELLLQRRSSSKRLWPGYWSNSCCSHSSPATLNRNSEYESIFKQIDDLALRAAKALQLQQYDQLGMMMNVCHGLLNALQVSTPDIEQLVALARNNGAVGAKLTGAGGGGAVVALCPDAVDQVTAAVRQAGYRTLDMKPSKQQFVE